MRLETSGKGRAGNRRTVIGYLLMVNGVGDRRFEWGGMRMTVGPLDGPTGGTVGAIDEVKPEPEDA
jgi:hypothetical protein